MVRGLGSVRMPRALSSAKMTVAPIRLLRYGPLSPSFSKARMVFNAVRAKEN
jgi:hypothetical protein